MSVKNYNCPGCGAPVYTVTQKCPYCGRLIEIDRNNDASKNSGATLGDKINNVINSVNSTFSGIKKESPSEEQPANAEQEKTSTRAIAIILCLFFGSLGVHCFYLNRRIRGVLMIVMLFSGVAAIASIVLWFIDLISLLTISNAVFESRYNKRTKTNKYNR